MSTLHMDTCTCVHCGVHACMHLQNVYVHVLSYYIISACSIQTKDIIEYLKRLSKTSIPGGIEEFIKVSMYQVHIIIV